MNNMYFQHEYNNYLRESWTHLSKFINFFHESLPTNDGNSERTCDIDAAGCT